MKKIIRPTFAALAALSCMLLAPLTLADGPISDADVQSWQNPKDCSSVNATANLQADGVPAWKRVTLYQSDPKLRFTLAVPFSDQWSAFGRPFQETNMVDGRYQAGRPVFEDPKAGCAIGREYVAYAEYGTVAKIKKWYDKGNFDAPLPPGMPKPPSVSMTIGARKALLLPEEIVDDHGNVTGFGFQIVVQYRGNSILHLLPSDENQRKGILNAEMLRMIDSMK